MSVLTEIRDLLKKQTLSTQRVLTVEEVAEFTKFEVGHIYQLVSKKLIPHSKPTNGKLFFDREKIEAWLLSKPAVLDSELDRRAASYIMSKKK